MKVLIADDNRLMLEGFRRALESVEDIEIVGATHAGAHVLSLIERRRPEVVVIELGIISWVRHRYMDTPALSAALQVGLGGILVFVTGVLIGNA